MRGEKKQLTKRMLGIWGALLACVSLLFLGHGAGAAGTTTCGIGGCSGTVTDGFCSLDDSHYQQPTTKDGVYQISNGGELYWFANYVNGGNSSANAILMADITVNTNVLKADGTLNGTGHREWPMIGTDGYSGTFDGNGKTVSGLYVPAVNNDDTNKSGMFYSILASGEVRNLTVAGSYISGHAGCGGIAYKNNGTIRECINHSSISSKIAFAAGITAINNGTITGCENHGTISAPSANSGSVGGIVHTNNRVVDSCFNYGKVKAGQTTAGGIANKNATGGQILNCGNLADNRDEFLVGAMIAAGGIVHTNESGATIANCFNNAYISAEASAGEIAAINAGTVTNCYYLSDSASDSLGKTAAQFASGEVTYLLNGSTSEGDLAWHQNLASDAYPVLDGDSVVSKTTAGDDTDVYTDSYGNATGICGANGDNLTWVYAAKADTKTLTIRGTGAMKSYDSISDRPWHGGINGAIEKVVVGGGVTSIGDYAFRECTSLTSIAIPDGVTSIGDYAFWECTSLMSIAIPDSVTSIGDSAFWDCDSLTSIAIPDGVTSIGDSAFYACNSLMSIAIPDGVTSIGEFAFCACTSLVSIAIPDNVKSIEEQAFSGCTSLTSIDIPDGVMSIGLRAFDGCAGLESIAIPDSVTSIGKGAFADCTSLTLIDIPEGVTCIEMETFKNCTSLVSIDIPDSVTSIGRGAFYACTSLTLIDIPEGVTCIEFDTFDKCTSLVSIDIPDNVTSIENQAFTNCTSLTSIDIPDSVTSIGIYAFLNCTSLTSIDIPDNVSSIKDRAFRGCTNLTTVSLACNTNLEFDPPNFFGATNVSTIKYNHVDNTIFVSDDTADTISLVGEDCGIQVGNAVLSAPDAEGLVYNGVAKTASVNNTIPNETPTITYAGTNVTSNQAINAGIYTATMSLGGESVSVGFEITQAEPTADCVASAITYGQTLANAILTPNGTGLTNGVYEWKDDTVSPTVGTHTDTVIFTPMDSVNYKSVEFAVSVTVNQAEPTVGCVASAITYGQTLGDAELTEEGNGLTAGSYAWKDATIRPTVADSGTTEYTVVFTPDDSVNYKSAEFNITVTVNKAQNVPNAPAATKVVDFSVTKLADITLPAGWVWRDADADIPEGTNSFVAEYTAADAENYENVTVTVSVTHTDCAHASYDYSIEGTATIKRECASCHGVESITLVVPTAANELVYDGQAKTVKYRPEEDSFTPAPELAITGTLVDGKVVNAGDYTATLTWGGVSVSAAFTVAKAEPDLGCTPANVTLTYGQTLGTVTLTATGTPGTYTWAEPTVMPTVADSGLTQYTVVFTPDDSANYKGGTLMMTVTVNKATLANVPGDMTVGYDTETLSSALLGSFPDWSWETEGVDLAVGTGIYNAIYNGADKGNYTNETVVVAVTRTSCQEHSGGTATCKDRAACVHCGAPYGETNPTNHAGGTELRNQREATCTAKEYTGDTYCLGCESIIDAGEEIGEALGHEYGDPVVTVEPQVGVPGEKTYTCTREGCGHSYTEEIPALDPETTPNPDPETTPNPENPTTTPNPTPELPELTPTVTPGAIVTPTVTPEVTPDTPTTTPEVTPDTPTDSPTTAPDTPTDRPTTAPDTPTTNPTTAPDIPTPPSPSYPSVVPTPTPVPTPVWTPTPVPIVTPEATATPVPTATPTATATPEVTEAPKPTVTPTPVVKEVEYTGYTVQVGAFAKKANAERCEKNLMKYGFGTYLDSEGRLVKVQTDVYETKAEALAVAQKLRREGFYTFVVKTTRVVEVTEEEVQNPSETKPEEGTQKPQEGIPQITPVKPQTDIEIIARDVILGRWGNGIRRKELLEAAGYVYRLIQDKVNELLLN